MMRERDAARAADRQADAAEVCLGSWKSLSLSHVTACLVDNMYVCSKTARATKALLYLLCYTILNFIGPALKIGNEFIARLMLTETVSIRDGFFCFICEIYF